MFNWVVIKIILNDHVFKKHCVIVSKNDFTKSYTLICLVVLYVTFTVPQKRVQYREFAQVSTPQQHLSYFSLQLGLVQAEISYRKQPSVDEGTFYPRE